MPNGTGPGLINLPQQPDQINTSNMRYTDIETDINLLTLPAVNRQKFTPFPSCTLQEIFEKTVEKHPQRTAVVFNGDALTYEQLNKNVNKLAFFLRKQGARRDQLMGIITERSFEMMIGIYGIIKAGCAYLPLSPNDPDKRIQNILQDAAPAVLLVQQKFYARFAAIHPLVICIETILEQDLPADNPTVINTPADLAYVIYTSGSTGMPKGVLIEHHSVVNRLTWMQEAYPITSEDVILQKTPYTFDVSVWELFWWAFEGAAVCLPLPNNEKNPMAIVKDIEKNKVSVLHFVPSMFNVFLEYVKLLKDISPLASMRLVFTSGEALQVSHCKKFNQSIQSELGTRLINLYGPTEATVDVTHYLCPKGEITGEIPIGKPISNTAMYILKDGNELPAGQVGELCIAGTGLARGYLNRVELTHEKFACPFRDRKERVYKTGDLACRCPDGNLLYYGRIDQQVKIRGIRIELGEIESVLNEYPGVESCLVDIKRPSENVVLLVAFYVAAEEIPAAALKAHMKKFMPEYMIPNFFQRIGVMPLTVHGKINRSALPELSLK
jgi:D-alanine--poly(phosphoribitol) ligase subunit 1